MAWFPHLSHANNFQSGYGMQMLVVKQLVHLNSIFVNSKCNNY